MKFMMNGAVTIGTMDGANVEMFEQVGADNMFIFGATAEEIRNMERFNTYDAGEIYSKNGQVRDVLNMLIDGTIPAKSEHQFQDLYHSLIFGDYDKADKYFLLYDLPSYTQVYRDALSAYADKSRWLRMAAVNTAKSGIFSSDRTIEDYNRLIWGLETL